MSQTWDMMSLCELEGEFLHRTMFCGFEGEFVAPCFATDNQKCLGLMGKHHESTPTDGCNRAAG